MKELDSLTVNGTSESVIFIDMPCGAHILYHAM